MSLKSGKKSIGPSSSQIPEASTLPEINTLLSTSTHETYVGHIQVRSGLDKRKKLFNKLIQQPFKLLKVYTGDTEINRASMVLAFMELIIKLSLLILQLILQVEVFYKIVVRE